jgi:hypothetical protein
LAGVAISGADSNSLGQVVFHDIACRNVATIGGELADEFATHPSATASDYRDSTRESFFKTFIHGFPQCVTGGNHNLKTQ